MRNSHFRLCLIGLGMLPTIGFAQTADIKFFVVRALQSNGAPVTGVISGPVATFFQAQSRSMQPVQVEARRVKAFTTEGCGRVELKLRQDIRAYGKSAPIQFPMEMNYCIDGTIPLDTTEAKGSQR